MDLFQFLATQITLSPFQLVVQLKTRDAPQEMPEPLLGLCLMRKKNVGSTALYLIQWLGENLLTPKEERYSIKKKT